MNHPRLSAGKISRLQAASSERGVLRVLAIDHRRVLVRMMNRDGRDDVSDDEVKRLKLDVVRQVGSLATAVILDCQYGAIEALIDGDQAPRGKFGLIVSLSGETREVATHSAGGSSAPWTVARARAIGASGVKLYLAYHPDAGERSRMQEELVGQLVRQCADAQMPLFLEPVVAPIDPGEPADSPRFAGQRRRLIIRTAARLGALGPDVLKLQFPLDSRHEASESAWRAACRELNDAAPVPWALLSAGEPFEMFQTQVQIACEAGSSGFMAGRAVWSEVATADPSRREAVLAEIVRPRMESLGRIAERFGHSWMEKHPGVAAGAEGRR